MTDDPINPFSRASLDARKFVGYIRVPDELLMDAGVIPDTRPRPRRSLRTRFRWRVYQAREQAGRLAYRLIAGQQFPDDDSY